MGDGSKLSNFFSLKHFELLSHGPQHSVSLVCGRFALSQCRRAGVSMAWALREYFGLLFNSAAQMAQLFIPLLALGVPEPLLFAQGFGQLCSTMPQQVQ